MLITFVRERYLSVVVVGLLVLGIIVRLLYLGEFRPIQADEETWLMVGVSLLQTGVPTTWSLFNGAYLAHGGKIEGVKVSPYLDHPPLFSLLVGGWAYVWGERDIGAVNWTVARVPMILITALSMLFTFLLVRRLWGDRPALFTLVAFVFFPTHVVTARFITPEHLIGLLLIMALYILVTFEEERRRKRRRLLWWGLAALSLLSPLLKLSGVIVPAVISFTLLLRRRYRTGLLVAGAGILSLVLFMSWGAYFNWDLFLAVQEAHQNRSHSFYHFWQIFTFLNIGHYDLFDPSIIVGLIGLFGLALDSEKNAKARGVFVALFVASFLYSYLAPTEAYGWYRYLLYPLLAIGLGYIFDSLFQGRVVYWVLFLPLLAIMVQHTGLLDHQMQRRVFLLAIYTLVSSTLLMRNRFVPHTATFLSLLMLLCLLEIVWVVRVLTPVIFVL